MDIGGISPRKMMLGGTFGTYMDEEGLEALRSYKYVAGGSTPLDKLMNPFWEWVVGKVPLWVSPNVLTLVGSGCAFLCMCMTCVYAPYLREAFPRYLYLINLLLLFAYQTLDSVDGKQARRTNTSTPLGKLFDHGCDAFSTVFAAINVLSTARMGISIPSFMLIAILQMQLFIYTWWEMPFHVYRWHTGVTGVTEGQMVMMGMNLIAIVFGPDIFLTSLGDALPGTLTPFVPTNLQVLPVQFFVAGPFYLLLIGMLMADVINGCRLVKNKRLAIFQLLGFLMHVLMQFPLFFSDMMDSHPVLCFWTIVCSCSIIALRLNIAATCQMYFSPIQWPVVPFWIGSIYLYATGPSPKALISSVLPSPLTTAFMHAQQPYRQYVLVGVLLWSGIYLYDFLLSTVSRICSHLNIDCFGVGQKLNSGTDVSGQESGSTNYRKQQQTNLRIRRKS